VIDPSAPVHVVARALLGARLRTNFRGAATGIVLTEVEAYGGCDDPASHAYTRRTQRNGSMYEEAGTLYVYRSYGVHWCANIVTGPAGRGEAVLLRAGMPEVGVVTMANRRGRSAPLTDGPGKLCQALGIDGSSDGHRIGPSAEISLELPETPPPNIIATPRVGISRATDRLWRFVLAS